MRRIATNAEQLATDATTWARAECRHLSDDASLGEVWNAIRWAGPSGLVLVNTNSRLLALCGVMAMLHPRRPWRLISLDLVLNTPDSLWQRLLARLKGIVFRQADLFVLYFRDTVGYTKFFGIPPERIQFVHFKVNSWNLRPAESDRPRRGEYLLCAGRSRRDIGTFLEAARLANVPCVLLHQGPELLHQHGTRLSLQDVPSCVRVERDAGGQQEWVRWLAGARGVVIPVLPGTISAAGISTYLDAMALATPVIMSACPAVNGLLDAEALIVPSGDATSLADAMRRVWEDDALHARLVARGMAHARAVGDATRLHKDVLDAILGDDAKDIGATSPIAPQGQPAP